MSIRKLNLGCGSFPRKGCINADVDKNSSADLLCDLRNTPYPFKDSSFELVIMEHLLEHLDNPFDVMREVARILIPGGEVVIKVPHFSRGFTHPDHKRVFDVTFHYYFSPGFKGGYAQAEFKLKSIKLKWFTQECLKRTVLSKRVYYLCAISGKILDFLANLSPIFCSRCWAFWVGGFDEIEFIFMKPV